MVDNILTKIGGFFESVGTVGIWVSIVMFALLIIYILLYSKTDIFTHSHYKFRQNFKKCIWAIIVIAILSVIITLVGTWITPNPVQSWEDF